MTDQVTTLLTARQAGDELDLTHLEVIRRIRKGQIKAEKLGWNWVIDRAEIARVREAKWYTDYMRRT